MSWKRTGKCEGANLPFAADLDGDTWIFRGQWSAHAWRDGAPKILWKHEFNRKSTGFMMLARAAGHAIAVEAGAPAGQSTVYGLDPKSGKVAWKRSLPVRPVLQGLAALDDDVFLLGSAKSGERIFRVRGATGELVDETAAEDVAALRAAGGKLWLSGGGWPLFGGAQRGPFKKVLAESVRSFIADGDHLYLSIVDEDTEAVGVVWLDGRTQKERGRVMLDAGAGVLVLQATGEPGRVVVGATDSSELILLDLGRSKTAWRKKIDIAPHKLAATPHEIVATLARPDQGTRLAAFDWASGDERPAPPLKLDEAAAVFWTGARLLVCGSDDSHAFAWEK